MTVHVTVRELRLEADAVYSVTLEALGGPLPDWDPGAHLDLTLPNGLVRQYSIIEAADDLSWYRIAVLREAFSRGGSEYVHYFLRPGQRLSIDGPRNHFPLPADGSLIFVAGGIGITPILAMITRAERDGRSWTLHYAGRTLAGMAFLDRLRPYGDRVRVWPSDAGRRLDPTEVAAGLPSDGRLLCCGPERLLDALGEALTAVGTAQDRYLYERFKPRPRPPQVNKPVTVTAARSARRVEVDADTSILDGLLRAGVPVTYSCRNGVCGACETRVLAGLVDHRDDVLTPDQQRAGDRMLVCVSRSCGPELTLDV